MKVLIVSCKVTLASAIARKNLQSSTKCSVTVKGEKQKVTSLL